MNKFKKDSIKTAGYSGRWHGWRSQNPLIRTVLEENHTGKNPLGSPRMKWEDVARKLRGCFGRRIRLEDTEIGYRKLETMLYGPSDQFTEVETKQNTVFRILRCIYLVFLVESLFDFLKECN